MCVCVCVSEELFFVFLWWWWLGGRSVWGTPYLFDFLIVMWWGLGTGNTLVEAGFGSSVKPRSLFWHLFLV